MSSGWRKYCPKQSTLHRYLLFLWIGLTIPTVLWWRDSVFWVSLMSLYAIVSTHWTGLNAAQGKEAAEKTERATNPQPDPE